MKKLEFKDFSLTYDIEGKGSDVLLLHGFPSNIYFWNSLKNKLLKNYRVTTVEQRGYPLSSLKYPKENLFNIEYLSTDIENLINHESLNNDLVIVGHDWGSIVGWAIASRAEVSVAKLVSICGGTEFPLTKVYKNLQFHKGDHYISTFQNVHYASKILEKNLDMFFRSSYRVTPTDINIVDLSFKSLFMNEDDSSLVHDIDLKAIINHFKTGLSQQIYWYANIDYNSELSNKWRRKLDIPVDFLFGKNDIAVQLNTKMRERIHLSGEFIKIIELINADHWLPLTHEESVIESINNI